MNATPDPHAASIRSARPLGVWMILTVLVNIVFCTSSGHDGDIGYWVDWIGQLQARGYAELNANYPPVYMHWLWGMARVHQWLDITVVPGQLLRFLANTPVLVAHLVLLSVVDGLLQRAGADHRQWQMTVALTALNPAILMNGPLWGQVDLLFSVMLVLALALLIESRYVAAALPLLALAVLTKFQAICVAPVVLPLLYHRRGKVLIRGIFLSTPVVVLLLLPYWLGGSLHSMVRQTYLEAASLYPYASFNAQNLWYLLGLNERPDNLFIFDFLQPAEGWRRLFTPKMAGMLLCVLWSLWLMISSFRRDDKALHWRNAILAALGFFLFLPAMHERYLIPAAVIALAAAARYPRFMAHAIWLSLLVTANMAFVLRPHGGLLPYLCSALTVLFAIWAVGERRFGRLSLSGLQPLSGRTAGLVCLALWGAALGVHLARELPSRSGIIDATEIRGRQQRQDWGDLRIGLSVGNNVLSAGGKRFASGFGTHARSSITLPVPPRAQSFTSLVAVDDESTGGEVAFIVLADGIELWRSGTMRVGDPPREVQVSVAGRSRLELIVDPLGANTMDHADWLEPRFHAKP